MAASTITTEPRATRTEFTADTLPVAVGELFRMNNYDIRYDVHVHGAQIDLVATAKGDPFAVPIYIEATVEYVSNDKYAKDSTKFLLIRSRDPGAKLLCISSKGFTAGVKERALESAVEALTYGELFAKFEKFQAYLDTTLSNKEVRSLVGTYEEPFFNDDRGKELAVPWLMRWRTFAPENAKWLIVLGEYGTGKTSLTRVLQYRWLLDYHSNPASPIPVRIELRNFSKQFDANGLLHHFLDTNGLSHVPIEFMAHLIRTGRVILLLDGYDEMAQFLNARERRACLSALADLAAEGAKGILTSRPNYFTESEELNVFEALYRTIEQGQYHLSAAERSFIVNEQSVDELIERYILNKYERSLQDLNPEQTRSLVRRKLGKDQEGQKIVLDILERVFREESDGRRQALSGKPVIITYLLELIDDLRADVKSGDISSLTEWQVYKLIVDKLMLRDLQRTGMNPNHRRVALQKIALSISTRERQVADQAVFDAIIEQEFQRDLKPLSPDERRVLRGELFEDLRSSATLTRAFQTKTDGWVFSHNSLREFLVAEYLLNAILQKNPVRADIPISSAMRGFAASIASNDLAKLWNALAELWPQRETHHALGPYICLLWDAARREGGGIRHILSQIAGEHTAEIIVLSGLSLKEIDLSLDFSGQAITINARDSAFTECNLSAIDLTGSRFAYSIFDTVSFKETGLTNADFNSCFIFECDFTGASVDGANFENLDTDSSIIIEGDNGTVTQLSGNSLLGYLSFHGAVTNTVEQSFRYMFHPKFPIVKKIVEKISEQKLSQFRGLTQRGGARADPPFARGLVERLASEGWVTIDKNDLVAVTASGRSVISRMVTENFIPERVIDFIVNY